ncbi:hypothetical protein CEUSTIGMA_g5230.t1 [Chlamydomonas eustigma]|uniref:Uncharacterized protein n=1 Tax=Chlamydomonas eustigma TaxID=1157962 RepID=A0A250X3Y2_9CHLO|nr:hypothetical protein CEUSTIGMA_g5230.t1 [Chlamydomonas eustigma]|eukprot:GAX77787.1 hypothetical protein CEUSTIGMA_g5230.t1 [Chlamydomonas eustigma]
MASLISLRLRLSNVPISEPSPGKDAEENKSMLVVSMPDPLISANQTDWPVWWFAPYFDRTSFGKEAATLVLGMIRSGAVNESHVWLGTTQGDCKYGEDDSMPKEDFIQLDAGVKRADIRQSAIVVCHSLPPFWARPLNKWETCAPCPPIGYTAAMAIGRAMAETDVYNSEFIRLCQNMDEIWVPSKFSRDTLALSGMNASKIRIVPIAVNTTMFNPKTTKPLKLPIGDLVFGRSSQFSLPAVKVGFGLFSVIARLGVDEGFNGEARGR